MRYFIISDEGGNPIYYDHKDGRLLSLVLVNTHIMMKENLGQRFKSMTCGHTLFVFQKVDPLPRNHLNSQPFLLFLISCATFPFNSCSTKS